MNIEELRNYCLSKKGVTEDFPFDETTLVFKVLGKMFALMPTDSDFSINLKCEPHKAIELREHYPAVKPGYHMSKKHWNTVSPDELLDDPLVYSWIDDSYDLVVSKLTKAQKELLEKG
ncbi:MAG: MmcQ/YjbR family DNA-binding protein [Chlorobi bacterium]|nr:MmcQ/YjbR family DNA-binding protein [Chlorobiota bacterium]